MPRAHRPGTCRGLEIIDEPLHDATLHEARGARRHALVVHGPRRGSAGSERVVRERERWIEHLFADLRGEGRAALQHGLAREGLGEGQEHRGKSGGREYDRERAFGRVGDLEGKIEARIDRLCDASDVGRAREIGALERVAEHEHVVARDAQELALLPAGGDAPQVGAHHDAGRLVARVGAGRVRHPRLGQLALDADVDLAPIARELCDEPGPELDEGIERRAGCRSEERRDVGERGAGRKRERQLRAQLGRGERAAHQLVRRGSDGGRARHADPPAAHDPQVDARLFRHPRGL